MLGKKKLIFIVNHFRTGAIPNIILDISPYLKKTYSIRILALQPLKTNEFVYQKCIENNIEIDSLNLNKFNFIKTYINLKNYLYEFKPDIIHSHLGRADIYSSLVKPKNSVLITTFHSVKSNYNIFTRMGYLLTDKRVDMRTAVSNTVRDSWYKKSLLNSESCTVYNPVNVKKFSTEVNSINLKEEIGISKNDYVILNIGNIRKQKGQIYLLKALQLLLKKNKNISLVIIGRSGDASKKINKTIENLNLQEKVFLLGFRNDIPELMDIADVFVFPSKTEGLGIAVLEAMAAKVPVIASNIEAINEYIYNGDNGFLIDYKSHNEIAEKIWELKEDKELSEFLIENASEKVKDMFNSSSIAYKYFNIYESLLKAKSLK